MVAYILCWCYIIGTIVVHELPTEIFDCDGSSSLLNERDKRTAEMRMVLAALTWPISMPIAIVAKKLGPFLGGK